jgi:WD40 repeat protein
MFVVLLTLVTVPNTSAADSPDPMAVRKKIWQEVLEEKKFHAPAVDRGLLYALSQFRGKCQIHMVYDPAGAKRYRLTFKFVRDGKEVLSLVGHEHSVFRESGNTLYFARFPTGAHGCKVTAHDLTNGKQLWETRLRAIDVRSHSAYSNRVALALDGVGDLKNGPDVVVVTGRESFGDYMEVLDCKTGTALAHKIYRKGFAGTEALPPPVAVPKRFPGLLTIKAHQKHVTALAFSPGAAKLASAGADGLVCFWNVSNGQLLKRVEAHNNGTFAVAFSPDGKTLASVGADHMLRLWDTATGRQLHQCKGHGDKVVAVAFSSDGKLLATGSHDSTIRLWNAATGEPLRVLRGHKKHVTAVAFSPDDKRLFSGGVADEPIEFGGNTISSGWSVRVRVWDVASGKQLEKLSVPGHAVSMSADGRTLVAAALVPDIQSDTEQAGAVLNGQGRIVVVDMLSGDTLFVLKWRGESFAFSADGRTLVTGWGANAIHFSKLGVIGEGGPEAQKQSDSRLCLWEVRTRKPIVVLPEPMFPWGMAVSPRGDRVAGGDSKGEIRVWDLLSYTNSMRPNPPEADVDELPRLWSDLAADDALRAHRAIWSLGRQPDKAMSLFEPRLRAVASPRRNKFGSGWRN